MHYATTADDLRELMKLNPGTSPSVFLADDSFAAVCYDEKTVRELISAFNRDADVDECRKWRLSAAEWREQIYMALIARQAQQQTPQGKS